MLGLVNDWVGMWMGQVLQWVWLHGRNPLAVVGRGTRAEDLAEVGWSAEVDSEGYFQEIESGRL